MKTITVRFDRQSGQAVKPVHGICNGPLSESGLIDTSAFYEEIGIPFIRLHDTDTPTSRTLVDISRIFPNFDADESDPANYFFEHTDQLLLAIDRLGAKPIYRLGESIDHSIFKRYARPPKDFEKWTRICVNIIRHYNEGWAGGFTLGISYWEIWNEPDLGNEMWDGGTAQQYRDLYKTAAAGIKALDPSLKVGGCALAGVLDFAEDFFRQCAREAIPLDFFSFHLYYRRMEQLESYVTAIDRLLAKYGLSHVERIFDEWNYFGSDDMPDLELWRAIRDAGRGLVAKSLFETAQSEIGASFAAASMIEMNRLPVDIATYYDGQPKLRYCGLFDRYAVPQKTYHAFRAYGRLYRLGGRIVETQARGEGLYVLAAAGEKKSGILISNYGGESDYYTVDMKKLHPARPIKAELYLLNHDRDLELERIEIYHCEDVAQTIRLENHTVCLLELTAAF